MHTQWSNKHTILVDLQVRYEHLETETESVELNGFLTEIIEKISSLPTYEVKHCDSLICES